MTQLQTIDGDAPFQAAFFMPDDPFDADWDQAWQTEPEPVFFTEPLLDAESLFAEPPAHDERHAWHDARLIGVLRAEDEPRYEIGCMDVYAEADGSNPVGDYLPIASFSDEHVATAFYHTLQADADERWLAKTELPDFALEQARAFESSAHWRTATPYELTAYAFQRDFDSPAAIDTPPVTLDEQLLTYSEREHQAAPAFDDPSAFHALHQIGIDSDGFDPSREPPPLYDAETGTAYWIGVFQPDREDREQCVTSILSLAKRDDGYDAQLAPCVPGDWDKAYANAEYLLQLAHKGGIEQCFDAAEGMALATDQRAFWEAERGLPLDATATRDVVDYAAQWEMER